MKIYLNSVAAENRELALIRAGIEAGKMGYDLVRFGKDTDELVFSTKKRCSRCGGNKFIMGVVGPGTGPQDKEIGSVPCPDCNKKGKK